MGTETITVVSGLPRSGTSMMMKMLEAGGLEILTDNLRTADADNPKGYYEFEAVKQLDKSKDWLKHAEGKVVKVISQLLKELPPNYTYKVIFMRRKMDEVLASQKKMLIRRGEPTDKVSDEKMAKIFSVHLTQVEEWLEKQPNMNVLYVHYNEILKQPSKYIEKINDFLENSLDTDKMMSVVDKSLYRQRAS
ncbi:sulfotransferase [candidate division KSB1 bacterium]|nr:sulfotransferase [candidate division KSB1 bacterium]NIR71796.1 sulfotransferase [candidate division KSB1 bacterium]NIS25778.1 sulfotransferase [candidate division KSB1 bacterium]NIT72648.1 sulfotransferase [candidate division KSB1 bacterium]NIU26468.1 sulfotransferase [candidate division KSB1 bacterium]